MASSYSGNYITKAVYYISNILATDPYLTGLVNGRVLPTHSSTIENPEYPLITFRSTSLGTYGTIAQCQTIEYLIDVWSKRGVSELHQIYSGVDNKGAAAGIFPLLVGKSFYYPEVLIGPIRLSWMVDDMFHQESRTYHLQSRFVLSLVGSTVTL